MFLKDCVQINTTVFAKAQPTAKWAAMNASCALQARNMLSRSPTYAGAWLVLASIEASAGEASEFRTALRKAYASAPRVHWVAEVRADLAEKYAPLLEAVDQQNWDSDLGTLLESGIGTRMLARKYARFPDLRERLIRVVERAPAALQRRFLNAVDEASRNASP